MNKTRSTSLFSTRIFFALGAIAFLITSGTIGYVYIEGFDFIDAFYMTVITMSTVGFEEVNPLSPSGKVFTSFLIILSFSTFAYAISVITTYFVTGQFRNSIQQRRMKNSIDKLNQHIILCGYGRVGKKSAKKLEGYGKEFVVIEIEPDKSDDIISNVGFNCISGDATKDENLKSAGIQNASALITTLPKDADNLYVVLTAREMNPNLTIISRASEPESVKKLKIAGATNVIMPDDVGGAHMASLVVNPDIMEFIDYVSIEGEGATNLEEIILSEMARFPLEKSISSISEFNQFKLNIIGCKRSNGEILINPSFDLELSASDKLFVLGEPSKIREFKASFA